MEAESQTLKTGSATCNGCSWGIMRPTDMTNNSSQNSQAIARFLLSIGNHELLMITIELFKYVTCRLGRVLNVTPFSEGINQS